MPSVMIIVVGFLLRHCIRHLSESGPLPLAPRHCRCCSSSSRPFDVFGTALSATSPGRLLRLRFPITSTCISIPIVVLVFVLVLTLR